MKKQKTLQQKILLISKAANRVSRSGTAEDGSAVATIGDVLEAVKTLMDRHGVILIPDSFCQINETDKAVLMRWKLQDEHGYIQCDIPGSGEGPHAISQAVTVSRKKAMECLFNLRVEETNAPTTEEAIELADTLGKKKVEQARKRAEKKLLKECVVVSFPDAHNGHKALFVGKTHIMEKHAFEYMEKVGKWVERDLGWLVPASEVDGVVVHLRNVAGCTVNSGDSL